MDGHLSARALRVNSWNPTSKKGTVQYLQKGTIDHIHNGIIRLTGKAADGSVKGYFIEDRPVTPKRIWSMSSHNAETNGTNLLSKLIPGRRFEYPKSLYAVEDTLRFVVGDRPEAVILDFFAGSGTTAHAVFRLNKQDGANRQSISITNNEVSAEEAGQLTSQGLSHGDQKWEQLGIFEHITRPRIEAALTGRTPDRVAIEGNYKFTDEFPISKGFEENVQLLELKYLDITDIELNNAFDAVAPLLWLQAGSLGPVISSRLDGSGEPKAFDHTSQYGILFDSDHWRSFVDILPDTVIIVFIVTDSLSVFSSITAELPASVNSVRLYENYLSTFTINRDT